MICQMTMHQVHLVAIHGKLYLATPCQALEVCPLLCSTALRPMLPPHQGCNMCMVHAQ